MPGPRWSPIRTRARSGWPGSSGTAPARRSAPCWPGWPTIWPPAADQRRAVAVALSGPRASAAVLTGLPVLGLLMGTAMGARPWAFLLESPGGRVLAAAGVLFDVAGVCWMRRILRVAGGP